MDKNVDIDNPLEVIEYVKRLPRAQMNYWSYYKIYVKAKGITLPEFRPVRNEEIPYVPTEE